MRTVVHGKRVVARAWTDPGFKHRLLADATATIRALGLPVATRHQPDVRLCVVENSAQVHNLVVGVPCSCYPRTLLGEPPEWYASELDRARAAEDPAAFLQECGLCLDSPVAIRVWDGTAGSRYMVLPQRPAGTDRWTEEQLAELVTPRCLIGTASPAGPSGAVTRRVVPAARSRA
jgi:nitrile hydratase subunit alpha